MYAYTEKKLVHAKCGCKWQLPDKNMSCMLSQQRWPLIESVRKLLQIKKHVQQTIIKSSFITLCQILRQTAWRQSDEPDLQALA